MFPNKHLPSLSNKMMANVPRKVLGSLIDSVVNDGDCLSVETKAKLAKYNDFMLKYFTSRTAYPLIIIDEDFTVRHKKPIFVDVKNIVEYVDYKYPDTELSCALRCNINTLWVYFGAFVHTIQTEYLEEFEDILNVTPYVLK